MNLRQEFKRLAEPWHLHCCQFGALGSMCFLLPGTVPNTEVFCLFLFKHVGTIKMILWPSYFQGIWFCAAHSLEHFSSLSLWAFRSSSLSSTRRRYTDSSSLSFPCAFLIAWSAIYALPLSSHPYSSCCFAIKFRILSLTLMSDLLVCLAIPWQL